MLLDKCQTTIGGSKSIVAFQTEGGGSWSVWDRYITIDGKKAYHIGNICGTCSFLFERLEGANQSINVDNVVDQLNTGLTKLDPFVVDALKQVMPNGKYHVLLSQGCPTIIRPGQEGDYFSKEQVDLWGTDCFWCMPHSPKTEYYRLQTATLSHQRCLFEFLVPMFPHDWLDKDRVAQYREMASQGQMPSAVTLSVLDVKGPANWEGEKAIISHWCLAHYLLDGHHKVYAAAATGKPLTFVSFLAVEKGISSEEEIIDMMHCKNSPFLPRGRGS